MPYIYNRKCRNINEKDIPKDIKPVLRFKSKIEGSSVLKDLVQGNVEIENITLGLHAKGIIGKKTIAMTKFSIGRQRIEACLVKAQAKIWNKNPLEIQPL